MSNDIDEQKNAMTEDGHSDYKPTDINDLSIKHQLSGMYENWFLDYASYVILERAVPHIIDGLKPVQRRILHSMWRMEDGRYNKVANIVGHTMQFHPHGDASIGDALVQLGQKEMLVDTQGNWGNVFTGDGAAAPRYIEAKLSKFALDVVFNPKTTSWKLSYDGRNKEPVTLPVKFPLLLAQGVEGIAVGLSSKILPHNFNEICDAAVDYLHEKPFCLYPDFQTGGCVDIAKYNDGERGGTVRVRAKIEKTDNHTLTIRELPYGRTVANVIDSIVRANDKGKIKIKQVEDMTSANVEILVHLPAGVSSDKTIDALYVFTDCEINIAPNCCVIDNKKPHFMNVSEVLRHSVDNTKDLLRMELEIRKNETSEQLHFATLEKIFIENRIYKDAEFENATSVAAACKHIAARLVPFQPLLIREVTKEDILKLLEIKMGRILKFNSDKANKDIARMQGEIKDINHKLDNLVEYAVDWYRMLKNKYGKLYNRRTEIRNFDNIDSTRVIEANKKLYVNRKEGFFGYGVSLRKEEFVANCSDLDSVIVFLKDGRYMVTGITDKKFIGKDIEYINIFSKNDSRTIYNVVYRDGKNGWAYIKRFPVSSIVHDREYTVTQGKPGSEILHLTANPNGEAETILISLGTKTGKKTDKTSFTADFSKILVKGRQAMGNILCKYACTVKKDKDGVPTNIGHKVWFDSDVRRINYDGYGRELGVFKPGDLILVVLNNGQFYTTDFDINNHYDDDIMILEKFVADKTWTAVLTDVSRQGFPYVKRFRFEPSNSPQSFLGDCATNKLCLLTCVAYPRIEVTFGGADIFREAMIIDAESFIAVKGFKAKGKRVTTFEVAAIKELQPLRFPEEDLEQEQKPDSDESLADDGDDVSGNDESENGSGDGQDKSRGNGQLEFEF